MRACAPTGLKYGLLTQESASLVMGSITAFLWLIEFGRRVSDGFRELYNSIFKSMLRKVSPGVQSAPCF